MAQLVFRIVRPGAIEAPSAETWEGPADLVALHWDGETPDPELLSRHRCTDLDEAERLLLHLCRTPPAGLVPRPGPTV